MSRISRRRFLGNSAAVGAAAIMFNVNRRVLGANDDVRVAVVGTGGRGGAHITEFQKTPGTRLVAICDASQKTMDTRLSEIHAKNPGANCKSYPDIRKLLDDKDIDCIATATPNHWHALATVWACQAGKDVYVEKPVSHEIWEGQKVIEAAAKYNRVVQHGTQRRSDLGYHEAFDHIRKGNLGAVKWVKGFCYKARPSIGKVTAPTPIPPEIDYNLWCGPAPMEPLMRKRLHYDWHWVWPTGNGDIGNQGVHEMDLCRWFLGNEALPERVMSIGGRFGYDDDATTPNTMITYYDYKPMPFIFEVRGLPRKAGENQLDAFNKKIRVGLWIQCENGYFAAGEGGGWTYDNNDKQIQQFKQNGAEKHQANFINACRTRRPADNVANATVGHLSSALCHMGNISYLCGKQLPAADVTATLKSNAQAGESFERMKEHLVNNKVNFDETKIVLGPNLTMDPATQRFTGEFAAEANKLVKREYRKPFEIPENV